MKRVGFVVHTGRDEAIGAAAALVAALRERDVVTRTLEDAIGADEVVTTDAFPKELDLVVAVGGDGTFLRAAHLASVAGCPVLGVKVGRMGFLTEVEPAEADALVNATLDGRATIEERMAVLATPQGCDWNEPLWGLNEIMVEKRARHRLVRLAVFMEGQYVTTFSGDGVIVAAPTGSTAYSFSARGPIVSPSLRCLVVTPVAAHMVFDRSFVLAPDERVVLEVQGDEPASISADGREELELPVGARVTVCAADNPVRFVRRPDAESFYSRIRDKFDLPGER
ncbi:MAG: NAD(+)/NADH kinase [Actinomycetota bacterium]